MAICLVLAFLALGFFYQFLYGQNILSFRDLALYFFPLRSLMVQMVKAGQLPLWNPYIFCGYPLLGTLQVGFFYPLSLIYYFLPFNLAFNYFTIIHYFLAALFMYWLTRHFNLARSAAFLSAIIFAFSGYLISMANMNTTLMALTWVPLALLCFDKGEGLKLSFILAMIFLGGEPTVLYLTLIFLAFYGLVVGEHKRQMITLLGGALLLAGGLAAIQLFPFMETVWHSMRTNVADYTFVAEKSFPPRELLTFLFPFFFGNLIKDGSYLKALLGDQHQIWLISSYCGFFPLFFAFSSWRCQDKRVLALWGAAIFSLFLALGRFTPIYPFLFKYWPGLSFVRYPVKFISLAIFALAILAGFGFQWWLKTNKSSRQRARLFLSGWLIIGLPLYWFVQAKQAAIFLFFCSKYQPPLNDFFQECLARIIIFNIGSFGYLLGIIFAGWVIFYLWQQQTISGQIAAWLFVSLVVFDLAANNIGLNPAGNNEILTKDSTNISLLRNDRGIFRACLLPTSKEALPIFKNYNENLYCLKNSLTSNCLVTGKIPDLFGRESMEPQEFMKYYWPAIMQRKGDYRQLLNWANVKYIYTLQPFTEPGFKLLKVDRLGEAKGYLFENLECLPRAFFMQGTGEIVFLQNEPNQVRLQTVANQPGVLFMSDTYYPGWQVYVDGQESKISRAKNIFRAVSLPAGRHQVKFVYSPLSFKLGAIVSFLTVIGLIWRCKR